jgi:hypothetical protein
MDDTHTQNMSKLRYTHIFQEDINNVFEMIKDHIFPKCIFEEFFKEFEFISGNTTWGLDNSFRVVWNNLLTLVATCVEYQDNPNHKKIIWQILEQTNNSKLILVINLFPSTIDLTTVVICEFYYDNNPFIQKNLIDVVESQKQEIVNKLEAYLKNSMTNTQIETIMIKANREMIWDLITDWTELQKKVPLIADKVVYESDDKMLGSTLTILKGNKFESTLKVIAVENNPDNFIWEFGLECIKSNPKVPDQEIFLIVERLEKDLTLVTFKHVFKQNITWVLLNALSKDKKKILTSMKEAFTTSEN